MSLQDRQILEEPQPPQQRREQSFRDRLPYVSYAVIGLSAFMFLIGDRLFDIRIEVPGGAIRLPLPGVLLGPLVREGQWWRVLAHVFEHVNSIHIFFNMSAVWSLGTVLERIVGTRRFLLISLITALGSAAMVLAVNFDQPTVGASGMILGWAGAFLPILPRESRQNLLFQLLPVAVISILPAVMPSSWNLPMISWAGHLGGFLAGIAAGFGLRLGPQRFALIAPVLLFLSAVGVVVATLGGHHG